MEVLRPSTGYEVPFDFDSPQWKRGLRELALAIIGERLVISNKRIASRSGKTIEDEFVEEIRYLVATASELFVGSLFGHAVLDAVEREYKRAVKDLGS